jgi:hypothetical protein
VSILTNYFSKCLYTWSESDVADSDSESECNGLQNTKIKDKDSEREDMHKQFILVPLTTHE